MRILFTLHTGNWPRTRRNTLCWPEIDPGCSGAHSTDRKSTWDAAEHTLQTKNWPGTWWNTLCRPKIDPGHGRAHSSNRKSTRDVAEQTLPTGNQPRMGRNTHSFPYLPPWRTLCEGYTSAGRLRPAILKFEFDKLLNLGKNGVAFIFYFFMMVSWRNLCNFKMLFITKI